MASDSELPALPEGHVFRRLEQSDYAKGFLDVLGQLTSVGPVSEEAFAARFKALQERGSEYHIFVVEDTSAGRIVAAGSLVLELKFIHECGQIGRVEDIVVDAALRGRNVGKRIILELTQLSKELGCYKAILNCKESNAPFYEKCGYERKSVTMTKYF